MNPPARYLSITHPTDVRVDKAQFVIIGLPDASIKESKECILSCLHHLDFDLTMKKITIHLSPAEGFIAIKLKPLIIAYELSRLCRVLSHSVLTIESVQ